ncbi:MAG TPA: GntR family transcriptional regulator [Ilumatobacteraceae bacterium]|nr:GntR family transcriptional regulator [Ilumatobacteraceae bacterium]
MRKPETDVRTIRYQEIAQVLRERIAAVGTGHVLPSESDLSAEFGVSRVTVRRALETLRDERLVESRQGFGWFSATAPLQQRLTQLDTIERQLEERGIHPERQIIEFAFVVAPAHVASQLHCEQVLRVKRVNRADGEPFAVVTVWCPAELGQNLSRRDVERKPFYELLGVALRGATQIIGAASVSAEDAVLLAVPTGSPVLRCERLTTSTAGEPILLSEHIFPAHRTEFVVDLPQAEPSTTPSGLRLVD